MTLTNFGVTGFQQAGQPNTNQRSPSPREEAQGQATFGMSNLRPEKTGLPFIVFISQRDGASHDVRVKVAQAPRVQRDQMGTYALRPALEWKAGLHLSGREEALLDQWVALNVDTLVGYWDGRIEYTEDALERLRTI
jgi:hypothetical protein